jgi:histidine ammonia-lyase
MATLDEGKAVQSLWSDLLITRRLNIPKQLSIFLHEGLHEAFMKLREEASVLTAARSLASPAALPLRPWPQGGEPVVSAASDPAQQHRH